ncbi:hypothetical protein ABE871_17595 [Enterococcus gilvus]|jgi:hypothetical protein|uniref:hypothetical protein n=1 Tax=Enterococcus gilvus TaxID=160453 RepID=UPI003D6BB7F0
MKELVKKLFTLFVVIFMLGGTILVLMQLLGMILRNGQLMINATNYVGLPTFICSAIAGVLGYIYSYFPKTPKAESSEAK